MTTGTERGLKRMKRIVRSNWEQFQKLDRSQLSADAIKELQKRKTVTKMDGIDTVQVDADVLAECETKAEGNRLILKFSNAREKQIERIKSLERHKKNIGAIGLSQEFRDTVQDLQVCRLGLEHIESDLKIAYKKAGREEEIAE